MRVQERPSFGQGYARSAGHSAVPWQWHGLAAAYAPALGHQGVMLIDTSGRAQTGTLSGFTVASAWVPTASSLLGLQFNGSGRVVIPYAPVTTPPLTLLAWAIPANITANEALISVGAASTDFNSWTIRLGGAQPGDPVIASARGSFTSSAFSTTGYAAGALVCAVGVFYDQTNRAAFLNGGGKGTSAVTQDVTGVTEMRLGLWARTPDNEPYTGILIEARVYDRAFSDAEVLAASTEGPLAYLRVYRRQLWAVVDLEPPLPPQFARPMSDVFNSGWETHTGATTGLYEQINEVTADDENFIQTQEGVTLAIYVSLLTALSDPGTTTGYVMRYTYGKDASDGAVVNETIQLRQDYVDEDNQGTLIRGVVHEDVGVFPQEAAITLTPEEIALITDPANLYKRTVRSTPSP